MKANLNVPVSMQLLGTAVFLIGFYVLVGLPFTLVVGGILLTIAGAVSEVESRRTPAMVEPDGARLRVAGDE